MYGFWSLSEHSMERDFDGTSTKGLIHVRETGMSVPQTRAGHTTHLQPVTLTLPYEERTAATFPSMVDNATGRPRAPPWHNNVTSLGWLWWRSASIVIRGLAERVLSIAAIDSGPSWVGLE